jgi:subfamily B ATP-binding cassette protein MsbA
MKHFNERNIKRNTKPKVTLKQAFKTIIWPRRNLVLLGLLLIVVRSLSGFVLPIQSKVLLDEVVPNNDYNLLSSLILIVIISIVVQALTSFLLTKVLSIQAQYLISELRAQVQKKVLSLPISFFDNTKSGCLSF